MTGLTPLTPQSAAVVAGWVHSRADAVLAGGPQFPFPLTADLLLGIAAEPEWRVFTLADERGRVVATASLYTKDGGRLLRIGRVIVDPDRRGEGWGRRVMEELLALTDADPSVLATELGVFTHNELARGLYERLGYRPVPGGVSVEVDGERWQTDELIRHGPDRGAAPSSS